MATKTSKKVEYNDQSITMLKGADRVRLRPAVIFGSDSLEGCEHSVFEILSNAVDEAKEGHGDVISVTVYKDHSIEIEDPTRQRADITGSLFTASFTLAVSITITTAARRISIRSDLTVLVRARRSTARRI